MPPARTTVDRKAKTKIAASIPARGPSAFDRAEAWLAAHTEWLVWLIVAAAFILRFAASTGFYLNYDEAQIMMPALKHSLVDVFRAGLPSPYGHLMNFVFHFMLWFGSSELYLRVPSIVAGALIPYVAYRWTAETFGKGTGLVTACILAFAPPLVILSGQLRFYIVHLFWLTCALYCLERAFREQSVKWMRLFGAAMAIAFLTMYMSVWFIAALFAYALVRIARRDLPRRVVYEWIGVHAIMAVLFAFAWFTTLRNLRVSASDAEAKDTWLRWSYYHPQWQSVWSFLSSATMGLFRYVFANAELAPWMLGVFVAGLAIVLWRKTPARQWTPVLSLLFPIAATAAAGVAGFYPFNGTRHDAFLTVFIAAGVASAISFVAGGRVLVLTVVMAVLIPVWWRAQQRHYLDEYPRLDQMERMDRAMAYLAGLTPKPRVLVGDQNATSYLGYYLCHGQVGPHTKVAEAIETYDCAGYKMLEVQTWESPRGAYPRVLELARQASAGSFPDPVWGVNFTNPHGPPYWEDPPPDNRVGVFGKILIYRLSP